MLLSIILVPEPILLCDEISDTGTQIEFGLPTIKREESNEDETAAVT